MDIKKAIPIGIESYKEIINNDYYYVDKTLLIRDLLVQKSKVTLFTRPRRFGKTLNLSMLQYFFEDTGNPAENAKNRKLFQKMKIMEAGEEYTRQMGIYPVINLTLKSAKQPSFESAFGRMKDAIAEEFKRHQYVLQSDKIDDDDKELFRKIAGRKAKYDEYCGSLKFLCRCLSQTAENNTIILIDEYDVPLENAYFRGFYDEMVDFIRSLLEAALKTNNFLQSAVITGCLRISKESIFTGLNNLKINSVLDNNYAEYFGFTQGEVDSLLSFYGISHMADDVKKWYDGYLFGHTEVYNPWSIINYVENVISGNTEFPKPYWSNTSSNSIVRKMIMEADGSTVQEIESLLAGDTIEKQIHENITYGDIEQSEDNLWNFLFFTGYLKAVGKKFQSDEIYLEMKIPNREVRYIYNNTIKEWFLQKTKTIDLSNLYNAILSGDTATVESFLKKQLGESISFMDSAEKFYHGFLLGLLGGLGGYKKKSNMESGTGRYDIILMPYDEQKPAVILELKRARKFTEMENLCKEALQQIDQKHYDAVLTEEGYPLILKYGICFCKKSCMVRNC